MPSLKRMSMGPRKKFDFFNGGRGIDVSERYDDDEDGRKQVYQQHQHSQHMEADPHHPHQPPHHMPELMVLDSPYGYETADTRYPLHPYMPPALGPRDTGAPLYVDDYHHPTTTSPASPTTSPYPPLDLPRECQLPLPPSYSPQGATSDMAGAPPEQSQWPSPSQSQEDEERKKSKRKQRCRLCANHDIYAEVKGHKWYCPYREGHNCEKCEITRKRQYYMAEQQKLTREQQAQQQAAGAVGCGSGGAVASPVDPVQTQRPRPTKEFPRLHELVRETSNIYNEELFQEINKLVRNKGNQGYGHGPKPPR